MKKIIVMAIVLLSGWITGYAYRYYSKEGKVFYNKKDYESSKKSKETLPYILAELERTAILEEDFFTSLEKKHPEITDLEKNWRNNLNTIDESFREWYLNHKTLMINESFRIWYLNNKYSSLKENIQQAILEKRVVLGMNTNDVWASRGLPKDIYRTIGSWGIRSQWIYDDSSDYRYLYFENGILTTKQD